MTQDNNSNNMSKFRYVKLPKYSKATIIILIIILIGIGLFIKKKNDDELLRSTLGIEVSMYYLINTTDSNMKYDTDKKIVEKNTVEISLFATDEYTLKKYGDGKDYTRPVLGVRVNSYKGEIYSIFGVNEELQIKFKEELKNSGQYIIK